MFSNSPCKFIGIVGESPPKSRSYAFTTAHPWPQQQPSRLGLGSGANSDLEKRVHFFTSYMGGGLSQSLRTPLVGSHDLSGAAGTVFQSSPDERAISVEFQSKLFEGAPASVEPSFWLPEENTIIDIIMDPLCFTQAGSAAEVWQDVLVPLFTGSNTGRPYLHQLLDALFRFLKERPMQLLDEEKMRMDNEDRERQSEKQQAIMSHKEFGKLVFEVTEEMLQRICEDVMSLASLIPANVGFSCHSEYERVTKQIVGKISDCDSALVVAKWGLFSGSLSAIVSGMMGLIEHGMNKKKKVEDALSIAPFVDQLPLLSFKNAVMLPLLERRMGVTKVYQYKIPDTPSRAMMACDGKTIYILGGHSNMTMVSLSAMINNVENRFRSFDLHIPKVKRIDAYIAASNGYLLVNGPFLEKEQMYRLKPFAKCDEAPTYTSNHMFRSCPKLVAPLASDGKYIYSLIESKKIAVFSLEERRIVFHRYVTLMKRGKNTLTVYLKLVPKSWMETATVYTNGIVFSFLVLRQSDEVVFEYFIRHFSLLTGAHISDTILKLQWPILSLTFDPWNHCQWALLPAKKDANLVKLPTWGARPPWLSGVDVNDIPSIQTIVSDLKSAKSPQASVVALVDFLAVHAGHFVGSSVVAAAKGTMTTYSTETAQVFCSATPDVIMSLLGAAKSLSEMYTSELKKKTPEYQIVCRAFQAVMDLLQYNLSNYDNMNVTPLPIEVGTELVEFLRKLIVDQKLSGFQQIAAFTIVTSFGTLFKKDILKAPEIFLLIWSQMSEDFVQFTIETLHTSYLFPYCLSPVTCRKIIGPIFEKMLSHESELQPQELELISLLQYRIMTEIRRIYLSQQASLPDYQEQLQQTFFLYSRMMTERMITFLSSSTETDWIFERHVKYSKFFRLFRKWLMLLQPLSKFMGVCQSLVFLLHPLFNAYVACMVTRLKGDQMIDDKKTGFVYLYNIFFELFSIYLDFIGALLDGGTELQEAAPYLWLVRSTIDAKINADDIARLKNTLLTGSSTLDSRKGCLKRGISFTYVERQNVSDELLLEFIAKAIVPEEDEVVGATFSYLYKTVKGNIAFKEVSASDRHTERLLFLAFMKQLGFGQEVLDIGLKLANGETPVLSHFVRMTMESIYRMRREIRLSKQLTAQFQDKSAKSPVPLTPSLKEDYPLYIETIREKCLFLICIAPCLRFQQYDADTGFPEMRQRIQAFLLGPIDIAHCFRLIDEAESARKHVATGIELINEVLESQMNHNLATFMLERLSAVDSIMKYLSSLDMSDESSKKKQGFDSLTHLLHLVSSMIAETTEGSLANTLIIFYLNLVMTIGRMDPDSVFVTIRILTENIMEKKDHLDSGHYTSYRSLLASCVYALLCETPALASSPHFHELRELLLPGESLELTQITLARICYSAGMDIPVDCSWIISLLKCASPIVYHPGFSLLYEVLQKVPNKLEAFHWIFTEISVICSGGSSSLLSDQLPVTQVTKSKTHSVKTPGILLGACCDMIQICRRCLAQPGDSRDLLHRIIRHILLSAQGVSEPTSDLEMFEDEIFLFAVFAILSNSIETFRKYSLIKDTVNNTMFYVIDIKWKESYYLGWQLPISGESIPKKIAFSSTIVPVSSMPFTIDLFQEFDLLLPYFSKYLTSEQKSNRDSALTYYVLGSLSIYCSEKQFLHSLVNSGCHLQISSWSFGNYAQDFINLLRIHLSSTSNGFLVNPLSGIRLMYCSPVNYLSNEDFKITSNVIKTGKGLHLFISSILNQKQPSILEITGHGHQNFNVGLHLFSVHQLKSSIYLYSSRNRQVLYNTTRVKTLDSLSSCESITLAFYPQKQECCLIDSVTKAKIHSMKLPTTTACFILHLFDGCQIQYRLSSIPPQSTALNADVARRICPIVGQAVFRRNRAKPMKLCDALKTVQYDSQPKVAFNTDVFSVQYDSLNYEQPQLFTTDFSVSSILTYPVSVVKECGHGLNTKQDKNMAVVSPAFAPVEINTVSNSGLPLPIRAYSELVNKQNLLITKYRDTSGPLFTVDDDTGVVGELVKSDATFVDVSYLAPLHPCNYPILPPEIINFFATGVMHGIRNQSVNQIVLRIFASPSANIESAMALFHLDRQKLLEYALSLLVFVEPLRVPLMIEQLCPIDFQFNVLDQSNSLTFSKYLCRAALLNIVGYLMTKDLVNQTMETWMRIILHQFGKPECHFVHGDHRSALIIPLESLLDDKQIVIRGATHFVIYRIEFSRSSEQLALVFQNTASGLEPRGSVGSNVLAVEGDNIVLRRASESAASLVVLPIFGASNEWVFGTLFALPIMFKYFVLNASLHSDEIDLKLLQDLRSTTYQVFIDSYIAQSPFFYNFANSTLDFIRQQMPLSGSDFTGDLPLKLSLLSIYRDPQQTFMTRFLEEQQMIWDERMLLPLKAFFHEFLTETDKKGVSQLTDTHWMLPSPAIPAAINVQDDVTELAGHIKRIMRQTTTLLGYPFHLLLHTWAEYASTYPRFDAYLIGPDPGILELKILWDDLETCELLFRNAPAYVQSPSPDFSNAQAAGVLRLNPETRTVYLKLLEENGSWEQYRFYVVSKGPRDPEMFIRKFRDQFVSDIARMVLHWDTADDEVILSRYATNVFANSEIKLMAQPTVIWNLLPDSPFYLVCVRTVLLLALNWLLYHNKISLDGDPALKSLCKSMSPSLRAFRFRELIDQQSVASMKDVTINREAAVEVRTGASSDLSNTIISQLTKSEIKPDCFRRGGDKPWRVHFVGESAIDAGGPARELVAEAAADIISPNCGLFREVPNARSEVGGNREYVIPVPNPRHVNVTAQYKVVGIIIGICIRSQIVQDLNFAPFVWDYLAGGTLTISDIFDIDQNYKVMIESLQDALKSNMDDATFQSRFNLRFVIYDSRGEETPLTQRGRLERVTLSNCTEFISLANEFRLAEMRRPLQAIRAGLWENLDFAPPAFISGEMLEIAACGVKEITYEDFVEVLRISLPEIQKRIFLDVLASFTSAQLSALLKFVTGRVRLPAGNTTNEVFTIVVDHVSCTDRLPTASTCFNQLHLPTYTSFERARKMISIAINFTATFENR